MTMEYCLVRGWTNPLRIDHHLIWLLLLCVMQAASLWTLLVLGADDTSPAARISINAKLLMTSCVLILFYVDLITIIHLWQAFCLIKAICLGIHHLLLYHNSFLCKRSFSLYILCSLHWLSWFHFFRLFCDQAFMANSIVESATNRLI